MSDDYNLGVRLRDFLRGLLGVGEGSGQPAGDEPKLIAGEEPKVGTRAFNVAQVSRLYDGLYNQGYFTQIEKIEPIIGPNFQDLGPNSPRVGQGPTAFAACNEMLAYIPGDTAKWTVDEVISEGNKVVVRWSSVKGDTTSSGISIYTLNEKGQIDAAFTEWNPMNILRKTGYLPEGLGDQPAIRLQPEG
jgi:hypothetical protein